AKHIHEAPKTQAAPVPPWARQTVRATGSALPPVDVDPADTRIITARMARTDALANLERLVNATKIDAKATVGDFVAALPESRTDLETFLSGARAVRTRYLDDGRCEVTVELFLKRLHRIITFFKNKEATAGGK
ncbi:MAG: hypothetical protein QF662_02490, partial [Phycisphaerae bacterium]|nr:hypothetical protein [Phycisphaerae bacterium]